MNSKEGSDYRGASNVELLSALKWQYALMDHYDEIFLEKEYEVCKDKAEALKAELRKRGAL